MAQGLEQVERRLEPDEISGAADIGQVAQRDHELVVHEPVPQAGPSLARSARSLRMTAPGGFSRKKRVVVEGLEPETILSCIAERAGLSS